MFFSDLDRTLIYSKRFKLPGVDNLVAVEEKEGRVISYMTPTSYDSLMKLKHENLFVPVTARKFEEIMRIGFIREDVPEWMICEAGRVIYHHGKRYEPWDRVIEERMRHSFPKVDPIAYKYFIELMESLDYTAWSINDYMWMTKVEDWTEERKKLVEREKGWFLEHGCSLLIQERKVYLFPVLITKAVAVNYLISLLKLEHTVSSGDADMDYDMFRETKAYIVPKHHTICENVLCVTDRSGMEAADDILLFVSKQLCS